MMSYTAGLLSLCALGASAATSRHRNVEHVLREQNLYVHHTEVEVDAAAHLFGTPKFVSIANELQLIVPQNIHVEATGKSYVITEVSPLTISNDQLVTVSFSASSPVYSDWIGAYSPILSDDQLVQHAPVRYGYCDSDLNYLNTSSPTYGTGSMVFNFTNLRDSISFYYFSGGTTHPTIQNNSVDSFNVSFINNNEPLRPRVVPTGDYDHFQLLWSSATSQAPQLKWGLVKGGPYDNVIAAHTSSITQDDMCGGVAKGIGWRDLGLIHNASLLGMASLEGQCIYYLFGDSATDDFSREQTFHVPPLAGTVLEGGPGTRIILYDDLGRGSGPEDHTYTWNEYGRPSYYTTMAVAAEITGGSNISAIYHGGDISYATGYAAVWDFWLDQIAPVASSVLYLTTVGNHESDWTNSASYYNDTDSGGECGVSTTRLMPMPEPAVTNAPWWSYDVGLIHMVGMSTEHNFTIGSPQHIWLANDLKNVDRAKTPWVVFGGHRAMYLNSDYCCKNGTSVATSDITVMDALIANVEPLLWENRVNIGFYGHNHVVQRQSAVYQKVVIQASTPVFDESSASPDHITHRYYNPQATVHMVVGTGGASFTENAYYPDSPDFPAWNEMVFYKYGYARVTAVNATYMDWEWVCTSACGTGFYPGQVLDHMVLTQQDPTTYEAWVLPATNSGSDNSKNIDSFATTPVGITVIVLVAVAFIGIAGGALVYGNLWGRARAKEGALLDPESME